METRYKTIKVVVPQDLIDRCWKRGAEIVIGYGRGEYERSRLVGGTGNRRIDNDVKVQAMSRVCECAGAMAMRLDPRDAIKWTGGPDPGWDFVFRDSRWDVKGSWSGSSLIWSRFKNHLLASSRADILMMVYTDPPDDNGNCTGNSIAHGWVTKDNFIKYKLTAGPFDKLDEGTYNMPAENLCWMSDWWQTADLFIDI